MIVSTLIECLPPYYYNCIYLPENVAHALQQGFTLEGTTSPHAGISASFNATDLYTAENLTSNTRLLNDPVMTVNLGLTFVPARSGIFGGAEIWERVVGQRGTVDYTQPLFFQPAAYSNLTAYVDFRVAPKIDMYLRGYNLGDERYADVGRPSEDIRCPDVRSRSSCERGDGASRRLALLALCASAVGLLIGGTALGGGEICTP